MLFIVNYLVCWYHCKYIFGRRKKMRIANCSGEGKKHFTCRPLASADPQTSIGGSSWQLKYGCDPLVSIWISAGIRIPMVIQKSPAKLTPRQIHSCLLKLGLNIIYTSIFPLMGKIAKQWNIIFMKASGSVKCEVQSFVPDLNIDHP